MITKCFYARKAAIEVAEGIIPQSPLIREYAESLSIQKLNKDIKIMERHAPHFEGCSSFMVMLPIYKKVLST